MLVMLCEKMEMINSIYIALILILYRVQLIAFFLFAELKNFVNHLGLLTVYAKYGFQIPGLTSF